MESLIQQVNLRVKGTDKFWIRERLEPMLQVRAPYLSEDAVRKPTGPSDPWAAQPPEAYFSERLPHNRWCTPFRRTSLSGRGTTACSMHSPPRGPPEGQKR